MLLNGRLETDLYVKPTDKHQYLLKSSCHPSHTKQCIPFSMALRLRRICSTDEFFNTPYREDINTPQDAIENVRQIPRSTALETSIKDESHRIPFVITFNPALPNIPHASHFQQPQHFSFFTTTAPRSIFFSSSYIVPPLQKPTCHTGQGQTPQGSSPPPHHLPGFGSFPLSQK